MSVSSVGGFTGSNLSQLAEMYRQQVMHGSDSADETTASKVAANSEANFLDAIGSNFANVERLDRAASDKAIEAATGDLTDVHDYVIAATQAQVATELTTTVRNKALEAFNDIMRMPL